MMMLASSGLGSGLMGPVYVRPSPAMVVDAFEGSSRQARSCLCVMWIDAKTAKLAHTVVSDRFVNSLSILDDRDACGG